MIPANVACGTLSVRPGGEVLSGLVGSVLSTLESRLPGRTVAVYVERQFEESAIARVSPCMVGPPLDGYSLEFRFASWLTALAAPDVRSVPTYLEPWLPLSKVLVVPLMVEGHHRGAIVTDVAQLGRNEVEQIELLAKETSATLAEFERSCPQGVNSVRERFATSVTRIRTSTQP